jgi:hypothetical protein
VTAVLPWIVAYLAILSLWAVIILRRPGPTLWKGRSLVALNIAFVLVSTAVVLLNGKTIGDGQGGVAWCCFPPSLIVFDLTLIIIALVIRDKWLLVGISHAESAAVLEKCFTQTRASSIRRDDGYVIQCGGTEMIVTIRPGSSELLGVRFSGGAGSKKATLVRDLFCKQFHNSLPTPRFRA